MTDILATVEGIRKDADEAMWKLGAKVLWETRLKPEKLRDMARQLKGQHDHVGKLLTSARLRELAETTLAFDVRSAIPLEEIIGRPDFENIIDTFKKDLDAACPGWNGDLK